ncbi:MAG: hypothetical protein JSU87_09855, partial [Gemmatimonadota bacterium]
LFFPVYDVHVFPVQAYWFDDGPYVVRAGREYRETIGSRVVAIAGLAIEEAYERFRPYIAAENEFGSLDRWSGLPIAEWLEAQGLAEDGRARLTLERPEGGLYDLTVRAVGLIQYGYWAYMRRIDNTFSPAVSNDRKEAFRFEYDTDTRSLYFDFNQSLLSWGDITLAGVLAELDRLLDANPCERFILDLRNNGGGDLAATRELANFVIGDQRIDRPGRLFVLIGRRTFSAGVSAAAMLRNNSSAILIGEPTGQGPNYFAGPRLVTLPNSRLPVAVSTRRTVSAPFNASQDRVEPDVRIGYTHDDFFNGRDPLREAALSYEAPVIATADVSASTLAGYVGRYRFSPHQALDVELDGGRLRLTIDDFLTVSVSSVRTTLYPTSETTFATEIPGVDVSFATGPQGATSVLVEWNGVRWPATRLPAEYLFPLELVGQGAIDEAIAAVLADSAHYATAVPGFESYMNRMGYDYLREGNTAATTAVFQLNVALFPRSSNAYDSLGEAYLVRGDTLSAVENYRRSLELDPRNDNAREMLRRMRALE